MLKNGDITYWTKGQIATTVMLADHANKKYDMGFDSYKPFRPIYEATFWPTLKKVQVRFIGEISNTEALEDMTYDLTLTQRGTGTVHSRQSSNSDYDTS